MSNVSERSPLAKPELKQPTDNSQLDSNISALRERGELGVLFSILYEGAVEFEPVLADIVVRPSGADENPLLGQTGGFAVHSGKSESGKFEIVVNVDDGITHYEGLLWSRRASAVASMAKMGFDDTNLDAKWLSGFIFLHELGHIVDYAKNYPNLTQKNKQREAEMATLPVPGMSPPALRVKLESDPKWNDWFVRAIPVLKHKYGVETVDELIALQDSAYRSTSMEDFADQFAARVFKPYS